MLNFPTGNGETTLAVLLPSKQGDIHILNCATGEPLTPDGETTMLQQSSVETDYISNVQPFSK